jgi:predicted nucleic acid-binding protein
VKTHLIDTGPIVAYLNRRDEAHLSVKQSLRVFRGQLATTCAVVSEVMYFISEHPGGPLSLAQFLTASRIHVAEGCQPSQTLAAANLMDRYFDTPMDFADATLVLLADTLGVTDVFTLDRRGFSTYRTVKGKAFQILP